MLTGSLAHYARKVRRSVEEIKDAAWRSREAARWVLQVERRIQGLQCGLPFVVPEAKADEQPTSWDDMGSELLFFAGAAAATDVTSWYFTTRATQPEVSRAVVLLGSLAASGFLTCGAHVLAA